MPIIFLSMEIKKLETKDLNKILEINRISFVQPWPQSEFEKHIEESFVAKEDGKIAGFIVGKTSGKTGTIKLIAVNPDCRKKGIGQKLIEYILSYFKEKELSEAAVRSRVSNQDSIAVLKSFGFDIIETVENYYKDSENAYLMKKEL